MSHNSLYYTKKLTKKDTKNLTKLTYFKGFKKVSTTQTENNLTKSVSPTHNVSAESPTSKSQTSTESNDINQDCVLLLLACIYNT